MHGHFHAFLAFEGKGLGHHRHRQHTHLPGQLRHHRRGPGAGAAAHAGGDEHHVGSLQHFFNPFAVFLRGLPADLRVGARTQALGDIDAHLQSHRHRTALERLRVGIGADEIHPLDVGAQHMMHGIAATATYPNHLNNGAFRLGFHQFEHNGISSINGFRPSKQ